MGFKRSTDEILLHQISLPARRDYQLRSCSPLRTGSTTDVAGARSGGNYSQLVARAFQNARALSFNASHDQEVQAPGVSDHRAFYSGPLTSRGASPAAAAAAPPPPPPPVLADGHGCGRSESDVSFATADSAPHSDDVSEAETHEEVDRKDTSAPDHEQYARSVSLHSQRRDAVAPRRAMSGELLRTSKASVEISRGHSGVGNRSARDSELLRASRASVGNRSGRSGELAARSGVGNRSGRSGELIMRSSRSINPDRSSEHMMSSEYGKKNAGSSEKGRGESKRRPTASIAWDSLNKSQENSPQHELAAIPFKWEEAPGKPITNSIAAAAERAMAKRFLRDPDPPIRSVTKATESLASSSPGNSFRGSHRFYAGERSRKSVDGAAHIISEVETNPHIDLVAPAAAKFLVENWVSPGNVTPDQPHLTTSIPFQWEAAPGVPKREETSSEPVQPMIQLQLPPRLAAPPQPTETSRGRQQTRSMSGPLAGHTSPSRRRQQQISPTVMRRSCSPSKRSISPSRIQALFSRKTETSSAHVDHDARWSSTRAIARSASGMTFSEVAKFEDHLPTRTFASGPLDYGGKPATRYSSPSKRSVSPSRRIHALAKQLTSKIRHEPTAPPLEDPNWPVSHHSSFTRLQPAEPPVTLYRENFEENSATTASSPQEKPLPEPWSPTSTLQGPNIDVQLSSGSSDAAKSLSRVSYESFEHSFAERESASTGGGSSPYPEERRPVGAAEGVKAIIKMCRSRRSKAHSPEMWAPTLASYFQCLEATLSNPDPAETRLNYTMPVSEQNLAWREYCDSPHAELRTCLGVKMSPARFITRDATHVTWNERAAAPLTTTTCSVGSAGVEDGYRSPAYAATLELLSPSAELFRKKKRGAVGASRGVKFILPSPSMRRKTQFVEAMCKSLKRALYKCAKRCCRKTLRSSEEPGPVALNPHTDFSFYKPN